MKSPGRRCVPGLGRHNRSNRIGCNCQTASSLITRPKRVCLSFASILCGVVHEISSPFFVSIYKYTVLPAHCSFSLSSLSLFRLLFLHKIIETVIHFVNFKVCVLRGRFSCDRHMAHEIHFIDKALARTVHTALGQSIFQFV